MTIFSVEQEVPEAALLLALGIIDADPASEAMAVEEISPAGATERAVKIRGPADGDETSYGLAYLYEGESTVLLVRGDGKALESRAEDLAFIEAGIRVPAAADEVATPAEEVEPLVEL